jgi:hypothetical protein
MVNFRVRSTAITRSLNGSTVSNKVRHTSGEAAYEHSAKDTGDFQSKGR